MLGGCASSRFAVTRLARSPTSVALLHGTGGILWCIDGQGVLMRQSDVFNKCRGLYDSSVALVYTMIQQERRDGEKREEREQTEILGLQRERERERCTCARNMQSDSLLDPETIKLQVHTGHTSYVLYSHKSPKNTLNGLRRLYPNSPAPTPPPPSLPASDTPPTFKSSAPNTGRYIR